jgi:hypothetical protein
MIAAAVTGQLSVGGHTGRNLEPMAAAGFTHVIDCRDEMCCDDHPKVVYLWAPTADDGAAKDGSWLVPAVGFALIALADPNTRLYVHCCLGLRRGPSMVYAILRAQGHNPETARAMVLAARPQADLRYAADADRFLAG